MFHARTLGRLGLWEILVKEYSFCAQGLNLGGYDSGFSNFSKKMGENGEIVRFLWYFMVFRKRTYGELMGGLGTSLIFL